MDCRRQRDYLQHQYDSQAHQSTGTATNLVYGILLLYLAYQLLIYFDIPLLAPQELLWNALVYSIPQRLLLDRGRRQELRESASQVHAAKSEALRAMLGLGMGTTEGLLQKLPAPAEGIVRRASSIPRQTPIFSSSESTDAPPGLGNWDNSCYQNSVLQGLASLESLKPHLANIAGRESGSTSRSLFETIEKLNDPANNGKQLWTPAKLKSMSSWQQQDAQEYFSKIMDELEKECKKELDAGREKSGLETITKDEPLEMPAPPKALAASLHNPLDGLLAQRVACTRCNHSDGLSLIPFNCLTLPLVGSDYGYDLEQCLDDYTKLEEITDVECAKCTLLHAEKQLKSIVPQPPCFQACDAISTLDSQVMRLPPELRAEAFKRLSAMQHALEMDDLSDKTLTETCQIPKKARVSSTKTRQAVLARAPGCLVVHVNRSVFDEISGVQRKNYAKVRFPNKLGLGRWLLGTEVDGDGGGEGPSYRLKAVVTHYGRHENGHYICFRQHPIQDLAHEPAASDAFDEVDEATDDERTKARWWRLSDEDVSPVTEEDVLGQGGVFMLFYEREDKEDHENSRQLEEAAAAVPEVQTEVVIECTPDDTPAPEGLELLASTQERLVAVDAESIAPARTAVMPDSTNVSPPPLSTATTDDESEAEPSLPIEPPKPSTSPPLPAMRTARGKQRSSSRQSFENMCMGGFGRVVAAT